VSQGTAKLNAYLRELVCTRVQAGWSVQRAAAAVGISRQWANLLWRRFRDEGETAFHARSRRPHRSPCRCSAHFEQRIERERRRRRWGPLRLSWLLGRARSTIYTVLRRLGLARRRDLDPRPAPYRRYERPVPGDLVHVDTKKLGRLGPGGGKRVWEVKCTGHKGTGWEYLHLAVDDRTRVLYAERLPTENAVDSAAFFARAVAYFADLGVRVRQAMTDGHMSYRLGAPFRAVRHAWGIEHILTPPYTPRWNGKVEAAVGITLREWAYARAYTSNGARARAFPRFIHSYTHRRPHGELGGLTPMQRLVNDLRGQHT